MAVQEQKSRDIPWWVHVPFVCQGATRVLAWEKCQTKKMGMFLYVLSQLTSGNSFTTKKKITISTSLYYLQKNEFWLTKETSFNGYRTWYMSKDKTMNVQYLWLSYWCVKTSFVGGIHVKLFPDQLFLPHFLQVSASEAKDVCQQWWMKEALDVLVSRVMQQQIGDVE